MFASLTKNHTVTISAAVLSGVGGDDIEVECTLWGSVDKPIVVLMGGISSTQWALDDLHGGHTGWWNQVVNEDSYLNTTDFCFLTFEYHTNDGNNAQPVTTTLQSEILFHIKDQLNLPQFHAVIGCSYGGMVSLAFAAQYPKALAHLICIAAADYNSVKSQALRYVQRQIIELGYQHHEAQQLQQNGNANSIQESSINDYMVLARSLAMIGYRGESELEQRFQSDQSGHALNHVCNYLAHHGDKFVRKFSASRYLQLSQSIDYHQIDVSSIEAKTQLIGFNSDQMVPTHLIQNLKNKLNTEVVVNLIDSLYGHDGFLLEGQQLNQIFITFFHENNHDIIESNHRCASGH